MKHSSIISDELLSAYIDHQIDEAELRRVETALAAEPALQHQLETLQATVTLMRSAPALVVPRALTLSENQVLAAGGRVKGVKQPAFWQRWLPRLMPVATAVVALLFIFSLVFISPQPAAQLAMPAPQAQPMEMPAELNATSAPPPVAEASISEADSGMQALAVGAPASLTAESHSVAPESKTMAGAQARDAGEPNAAPEPKGMTEAETSHAETAADSTPAPTPFRRPIPRITWLLGLLLALLLFLTWRITFARPRRQ